MDILFYQIAKILSIRLDKSLAFLYIIFTLASYPSGKGAVCKTVMQQFDSARRLAKYESPFSGSFFCLPNLSSKAGVRLHIWSTALRGAPFFYGFSLGASFRIRSTACFLSSSLENRIRFSFPLFNITRRVLKSTCVVSSSFS